MAHTQHLDFRSQIARIIGKGSHIRRNRRNGRGVDQVVVILIPRGENGIRLNTGAASSVWNRGDVAHIVGKSTQIRRNLNVYRLIIALVHRETIHSRTILRNDNLGIVSRFGKVREIRQAVVITVETLRQLHETAARQEQCVVADTQHLGFRSQISRIVVKIAHLGRLVLDKRGAFSVSLCPVCLHLIYTCRSTTCRNIDGDIRRLVSGKGSQHNVTLFDGNGAVINRGNLTTDGRFCRIYFCLSVIMVKCIIDPTSHTLLHTVADVCIERVHAIDQLRKLGIHRLDAVAHRLDAITTHHGIADSVLEVIQPRV